MEKLKPCPFCGGEAIIVHVGRSGSRVTCKYCYCSTAFVSISTIYSCDEKAAEAWNRRVERSEE